MTVNQPEVCVGGCLEVTAGGVLVVNVGNTNWNYDCPDSQGQPLYCGPDGILRTRPVPQHVTESNFENFGTDRLLNGGQTPFCAASITNPSQCLGAQVVCFGWVTARYQISTGNRYELRVESQRTNPVEDDITSGVLSAGRGAPGGGPARARAITAGNSPGDGSVGRAQVIASGGDVRRQNVSGTQDLVQSDSPVSIREGTVFSNAAVDTAMVCLDNGTRETGAVNGMARPRRFGLDPGDTLTFRVRVAGIDGANQDTFSDVNIQVLLMLTTQPQVP